MIAHKVMEFLEDDARDLLMGAHKFEVIGRHFDTKEVRDYTRLLLESEILRLPFPVCYFEWKIYDSLYIFIAEQHTYGVVKIRVGLFKDGILRTVAGRCGWAGGLFITREAGVNEEDLTNFAAIVACIVAFMDLKEAEIRDVPVKDRVNRQRVAQGKQPFFPHKVLTITKSAKDALLSPDHHASLVKRRAHWRRGHLRHLPDKIVPVAPALVRGEGFVAKNYRV